ncbi:Fic family protein [soil metagenome]
MKPPVKPPCLENLNVEDKLATLKGMLLQHHGWIQPTTDKGEYLHWDKLRHLQTPMELSAEQWWFAIKAARRTLYNSLPFTDKMHKPFYFGTPNVVLQKLHIIDRNMGNNVQSATLTINPQMRDTYLVRSLIEEAITSSQLEGAATTRKVAKEMIQTQRKPKDTSEQMIMNNYNAMKFIHSIKNEMLTVEIILELHRIITQNTLDDPNLSGNLRNTNDINVWDRQGQYILHTPPNAEELMQRLNKLCAFANASEDQESRETSYFSNMQIRKQFFIHPVIKAILLHFMLAYDHPFVDGNGRTARALFYWSMSHQGYWLMEYISISDIVKKSPSEYARAFLYTETDENDVTYFILHQLDVILKAIDTLYIYLDKQAEEIHSTEQLLHTNPTFYDKLNYRQIALIKHALRHPHMRYLIEGHRQSHNITYDTARNDLLKLSKAGLLIKRKMGKAFAFSVPVDLKEKIVLPYP